MHSHNFIFLLSGLYRTFAPPIMDRNTVIGFSLIFLILAGYYWYTAPTPEEQARINNLRDSIARVDQRFQDSVNQAVGSAKTQVPIVKTDSLGVKIAKSQEFAAFESGADSLISMKNEHLSLLFNTRGGRISSVKLNEFKKSNQEDLDLLIEGKNEMAWTWTDQRGQELNSRDFLWEIAEQSDTVIAFRLSVNENQYVEQKYTLYKNRPYVVNYALNVVGMSDFVRRGNSDFRFDWAATLQKQERDMKWEEQQTAIVYKLPDETPTTLTTTEEAEELLKSPLKWIAFKQQYFSAVIASDADISTDAKLAMKMKGSSADSADIKPLSARIFMEYKGEEKRNGNFHFYFGPNHYKTLENTNIGIANAELERIIPLGWGIFGWVNRGVVIPVFSALDGVIGSTGILIMILTIIIKTLLLPLVYKSYISTAKMRILKPEIEAIKEKHGNDLQKTQQENMALYKKAGVSPLSGCVPMLLQLPILFAMFQFFPVAFELRQKAFLWATDLSQYDGPSLGFNIPFYGDHVSFFTLLMTVSTLIYTHLNNQISGVTGQMKYIGYFMPVIFLGVLNDYASGLTWYYFVSNMITFGQQYVIRKTVDDKKLLAQIAAARKKPVTKTKFQERMELAMKASQSRSKGSNRK
jgi:YidC/Oxa1 family membrane protein insertase